MLLKSDLLKNGKSSQLKTIQDEIQRSMNVGWSRCEVIAIRTENLYAENRQWLESQGFSIKTITSPNTRDHGSLFLTWN